MPRIYKSEDAVILVKKEDVQGEAVNPDRHLGKIHSSAELPDPEVEHEEQYYIGSRTTTPDDLRKGTYSFTNGNISVKPVDELPFELLLGTDIDAGNIDMVTNQDELNSATFQLQLNRSNGTNFVNNYIGVVCGGGEITVSNDDDLIVDLDLTGLDVNPEAVKQSPTQNILDKDKFSFADTVSNLTMFGVEFTRLNDFNVNIDKNIDVKNYINEDNPEKPDEIHIQNSTIDIEAEIDVSSDDIYQELLDGENEFDMNIAFSRSNGDTIVINPKDCHITEAPYEVPEEGTVSVPVSIKAQDLVIQFDTNPT